MDFGPENIMLGANRDQLFQLGENLAFIGAWVVTVGCDIQIEKRGCCKSD